MAATWLEISISANASQRELLIPTMTELGCNAFQETDDALLCYIDKSRWTPEQDARLAPELRRLLTTISSNADIRFREIADTNWNAEWEQSIRPIQIGSRFLVSPSWHSPDVPDGRILLTIDPKMSFGTGYHETTRLMLSLLETYVTPGMHVLDIGTGTGILAIGAVKLGAARAAGIDNDEWSISNAIENITLNRVADLVDISDATTGTFPANSFDLIAANITLNTNIGMLPEMKRLVRPAGLILLAGFLVSDRDAILAALSAAGFTAIGERREHEWLAVAARRSA